ncbi:MAG: hypothetical protein ABW001_14975 [Mycobacterium sp.]
MQRVLSAASLAPSRSNVQPWHVPGSLRCARCRARGLGSAPLHETVSFVEE